ncbi:transglycosylase SLT domain-containing protein [Fibrella aquatilis]|uniref:Transglycosylase SLT domain-containing protein n=1 Tax=Fibrella aquatilis TaxID=2817059 RepID=A0A939JV14_9BACT|nr:transglycosylase SLT domain-containing protein [Fibrella aquatilis]MBO0930367.1 transglycosylase SLT domain-containing protein [Fibrella aquatilis]
MLLESKIPAAERAAFVAKVKGVATALAVDPDWLMATMWVESRLNPKAYNSGGGASGLIQFMPGTAVGLGTTTAAIRQMTRLRQLDFVLKYLKPYKGKMTSAFQVYVAVHFPKQLGAPLSEVWYAKTGNAFSRKCYAGNKDIDIKWGNNDGAVSGADVQAFFYGSLRGILAPPTTPTVPETKLVPETPDETPPAFTPTPYNQRGFPWLVVSLVVVGITLAIVLLKKPALLRLGR